MATNLQENKEHKRSRVVLDFKPREDRLVAELLLGFLVLYS